MRSIAVVFAILLASCTQTKVVEHQTAVPVEKIVYAPLDPGLFAPCPSSPQPLTSGKTNAALLQDRNSWQIRAECLDDELQKIQSLQSQPKPKP